MTKDFRAARERQLEPTAAPPPNTTGQKAWEQTDPALRPLHQWDASPTLTPHEGA
jgi:hypothetical protein